MSKKRFKKEIPYLVQGNSNAVNEAVKLVRKKIKPMMQRRLPTVYYSGFKHNFIVDFIKKTKINHPYFLKMDIQKFYPSLDHQVFLVEVQLAYKNLIGSRTVPKSFKNVVMPLFQEYFSTLPGHMGIPLGNSVSSTFAPLVFVPMLLFLKKIDIPFIVFADDFLFFFKTQKERQDNYNMIVNHLSTLKLTASPHKTKSGRFATDTFTYCGWEIKGGYYAVSNKKLDSFKSKIYKQLADNNRTELRTKVKQLNHAINGFGHHYKYGNVVKQFTHLDSFIRNHFRAWLRRNHFGYPNNKNIYKLGLRSLVILKQEVKQPIKTKDKYGKIVRETFKIPNKKTSNFVFIEELLEKQVEQNKQVIGLLGKVAGLLDFENDLKI